MFLTLKEKLKLLLKTEEQIKKKQITFNAEVANFGFPHMDQLWPVDYEDIKGYPCVAYKRISDVLKFAIKVIPMHIDFKMRCHPCILEAKLLKEFTKLVKNMQSPHITFYFTDFDVSNTKKAVTRFPLKYLRKDIYKTCKVLVAEYVTGGSIEEWIQEVPIIKLDCWKYIIFSVAWTLVILHDKYKFMHLDFHYGNVLLDTFVDTKDKAPHVYTLHRKNEPDLTFSVPNVGIMPKLWDFEFATVEKGVKGWFKNDMWDGDEENIPTKFNPYYDIHYFLMSMLELEELPDEIYDFIEKMYPPEVFPVMRSDSESSEECISEYTCSENGAHCKEDQENYHYDHNYYFYETDESSIAESTKSSDTGSSRKSDNTHSTRTSSSGASSETYIRTEYMLGDRLLNGTETKLKLPTPMDILTHEFFNDFKSIGAKKNEKSLVFSYSLT